MPAPARAPLATVLLAGALVLTGCGGGAEEPPAPASSGGADALISPERCEQNRAAGRITSLTGYQYQASASILDVVAAEDLGYFDDLCLDVEVVPGSGASGNAQLVAAGTAQVTDLGGGHADLLQAVAGGIDVTAVATLGHVPISTLMTMPEVTDLTQLEGTTLGHKGQLPPSLFSMLVAAGVDVGALTQVTVGFDPTVLPRGQVQSLTGYKSNEPLTLAAAGTEVTTWDPEDYGVPGSFGTTVVNPAFAAEHPTAVQDFLRASLHALEHCERQAEECVALAAQRSQAGYDTDHNLDVWRTESDLVRDSTPQGAPVGALDPAEVQAEGDSLVASGALTEVPDVAAVVDTSFLEAVHDQATLVWPAP